MSEASSSPEALSADAANAESKVLASADLQKILQCLPHRYPFLLVDRVERIDSDNSCVGVKNVTVNEPHFQGHFPGNPVMPGVLIIEGMAQTAGVICILSKPERPADLPPPLVYFMTIDEAKFRRPVVPGDVLEYHMTKISRRRNMWWYRGEAKVGGELVAEARLGAMITGF
ncbi:3-hydroxyacyl-ACP dehydratase FabZ [Xanthobacter sp. VNH20]|uniref:3-hydroxyacyl-ACP dehydratase FabZ n=1 Tax=Xanthobacter sp. VNH20 TaxID=3156616 RepID=UPI0032B4C577